MAGTQGMATDETVMADQATYAMPTTDFGNGPYFVNGITSSTTSLTHDDGDSLNGLDDHDEIQYEDDDDLGHPMDLEDFPDDELDYFPPVLGEDGEPLLDENGDPILAGEAGMEFDDGYGYHEEQDLNMMPAPLSPEKTGNNAYSAIAHLLPDATDASPVPPTGLSALLANASSYWSRTTDLGYGDGVKETARRDAMTEIDNLRVVQGEPMENPFHVPDAASEESAIQDAVSGDAHDGNPSRGSGPRRRGRPRGRGRGGFRWALKGTAHDPKLKNASRARGRGSGKRAGRPRGGMHAADPGPEFKKFQSEAMSAYMDGDLERTLASALEAIHKNPEVGVAHWLVSESLRRLGREKDSISALMSGAIIDGDAKMWIDAGNRTMQLDEGIVSRFAACTQAIYCYSHAMEITRRNSELDLPARIGIRDAFLEVGEYGKARVYSKSVAVLDPTNFTNLMLYAELCAASETRQVDELTRAKMAYESAFEALSRQELDLADVPDVWSHINIYLELLDKLKYTAEAIRMLKRLSRWVLGRKEEHFWDQYSADDREFDTGNDRRGFVGEFQQGRASVDKSRYGEGLPLEIRVKLGLLRVKMGVTHRTEAMQHLTHVLDNDAAEYYDTFYAVGESLRLHRWYEEALSFFEPLGSVMEEITEDFAVAVGECYHALDRNEEAEGLYRTLLEHNTDSVRVRVELARVYRAQGMRNEADPILHEVLEMGRKNMVRDEEEEHFPIPKPRHLRQLPPKSSWDAPSVAKNGRRLPNGAAKRPYRRRKDKEATAKADGTPDVEPDEGASLLSNQQIETFATLDRLWAAIEAGTAAATNADEWVKIAEGACKLFHTESAFFLASNGKFRGYGKRRYEAIDHNTDAVEAAFSLLKGTEQDGVDAQQSSARAKYLMLPTNFRGVPFDKWHRVLAQLCLVYAERGKQLQCYSLLTEVLLKANVFHYDSAFQEISSSVALCCALKFNDTKYAWDIVREYSTKGEHRASVPFQLVNGMCNISHGNDTAFTDSSNQKFISRGLKNMDFYFLPQALRNEQDYAEALSGLEQRLAKYGPQVGPPDASILIIYGNVMAMTRSRNAELPYYLRALAIQPDNPMLNLSIGISYIHQAMKRQTDNRHYGIQQGLSFVQLYHELRSASCDPPYVQEAEYNMAKMWHMLGLTHLAIPGYEKVLALSEKVHGGQHGYGIVVDYAIEAAYALQQLFVLAGNEEAAQVITEQWMVL